MSASSPANQAPRLVLLILCTVCLSAVLAEFALYSRNAPSMHPDWMVGKVLFTTPVMGAESAVVTRNLLAGNALNLQAWHGYQEYLYVHPLTPQQLQCRFRLDPEAYLHLVLSRDHRGWTGFRLSRRADQPSLVYRADRKGRFLSQAPLPFLPTDGWHQLELKRQGQSWLLSLDGVAAEPWPAPNEPGLVGFLGGDQASLVDDVRVWDDTQLVVEEGFRNGRHFPRVFALLLVVISLVQLLLWRIVQTPRGRLRLLFLNLMALATLSALFTVDYHYWSHRYPYFGFVPTGDNIEVSPVEKVRMRFATSFERLDPVPGLAPWGACARFLKAERKLDDSKGLQVSRHPDSALEAVEDNAKSIGAYLQEHEAPSNLVLVLGTSQPWGAGARLQSDRLPVQLHAALAQESSWVVNASRMSSRSGPLLKRYKSHLLGFSPNLTVLILGVNDADEAALEKNLRELLALNKARGIATLLVKEPISREGGQNIDSRHAVLQRLADSEQVPILDLHGLLKSGNDGGILFTDFVHLTPYGQELAGELIGQAINSALKTNMESGNKLSNSPSP